MEKRKKTTTDATTNSIKLSSHFSQTELVLLRGDWTFLSSSKTLKLLSHLTVCVDYKVWPELLRPQAVLPAFPATFAIAQGSITKLILLKLKS